MALNSLGEKKTQKNASEKNSENSMQSILIGITSADEKTKQFIIHSLGAKAIPFPLDPNCTTIF